jgi:hypothetical protein
MPSFIAHAEEYLFEYEIEDAASDTDEQTAIELSEKYLSYDEDMEAFEDRQNELAFSGPEECDEYYYDDDDYEL